MTRIYTPNNSSGSPGRTVDTSSMNQAGMGSAYGQHQDPLTALKGLLDGNNQGSPAGQAGISWERYGDSRYEDQAARDLRSDANPEYIQNQELIQKYAAAANDFFRMLCARRERFYIEYRNVLEDFKLSKTNRTPCAIRTEFVDKINLHPEMLYNIAKAATPVYAQLLIESCKANNFGEVQMPQYIAAIQNSIRMVLTMEMIAWLCKSPQGREKAFFLTPELKAMVGGVEKFKDAFTLACSNLNMTNPYAGLVYEVKLPIRADTSMVAEAELAFRNSNLYSADLSRPAGSGVQDMGDVWAMIERNAADARARRGEMQHVQMPMSDGFGSIDWETKKEDLSKINVENKEQFDYKRLFRYIGKDNYHVIPESDWNKVKGAFKRHPDQPEKEDAVLGGCFRVVMIDLDRDNGWFSTVVRGEGLDMATVLTNPRLLLPKLEVLDGSDEVVVVSPIAVEDAIDKRHKNLQVKVETCEKLEGIPLITVKEQIKTVSSKKLLSAVTGTNDALTKDFKNVNATSFNTLIWETYTCETEQEKDRIIRELPFLFKNEKDCELPFYDRLRKLSAFIDMSVVDDGFVDFVSRELTTLVNDWLINALGYDNSADLNNHLSVDNILDDFIDLDDHFKESNEEAWRCFREYTPKSYLNEKMKLFTADTPHEEKEDGIVQNVIGKLDIGLERPIHVTVINNRHSPVNLDNRSTEALLIRRSKFPEFFKLLEAGFDDTMGDKLEYRVTDKIINFSEDGSLWLFTSSALDVNVATLRRISTRRSLLFLALS